MDESITSEEVTEEELTYAGVRIRLQQLLRTYAKKAGQFIL